MQFPLKLKNLVAGEWVGNPDGGPGGGMTSLDPADQERILAHVPAMGPQDVKAAIDAAASALPSWRATPSVERGKLLFRVAGLIRERAEELRDLISFEMGKTHGEAGIEVERSAEMLEFYAGIGRLPYGDLIPDRSRLCGKPGKSDRMAALGTGRPFSWDISSARIGSRHRFCRHGSKTTWRRTPRFG